MGSRRKARALALQVLYAEDLAPGGVDEAVATYGDRFELDVDDEVREFARVLARAATADVAAIDAAITSASRNWRLERMAKVDRNILRLAVGELLNVRVTPVKVVINEAVELAKRFGTSESPAFVNGVLDRAAQAIGRRDEEPAEPAEAPPDADPEAGPAAADPE